MIPKILVVLCLFQQIHGSDDSEILVPETPGKVTICNSTYCDKLPATHWCPRLYDLHAYVTSENGDRFQHSVTKFRLNLGHSGADFRVTINPCKTHQKIVGFGGALTDASAWLLSCLSEGAKKNLLNSYFDCEKGIGYNLLRIPLGASDYSLSYYTYDDSSEADPELKGFALNVMDTNYKIPLIKEAQAISSRNIRLKGATWKAPSWVTEPVPGHNMSEALLNELPPELSETFVSQVTPKFQNYTRHCVKPEFEETWALYHSKILTEYKLQGINFEYLSGGNEVSFAPNMACWERDRYQNWIANMLSPILKENGHDSVKLLALDDQTPYLDYWQKILDDPATRSAVAGFATHYYYDYSADPETVKTLQEDFCQNYPEQILLSTESSICEFEPDFFTTSDWHKAERYAKDIILKLQSCIKGYIDWNIALDFEGEPNYEKNPCYSAVGVNCSADEFHKRALFYVLGHFSRFVPEDSIRVESTVSLTNSETNPSLEPLQVVAFKVKTPNCWRPNLVTIALNTNDEDVKADICLSKIECATVQVPKKSITSTVSIVPLHHICL